MGEAKRTVLVVDDDHIILQFIEDVLCPTYSVICAADGAAALEAFEAHEQVDLVLLDLRMPDMTGYEALASMQIIDPDVKVVVITGMDPEQDRLPGIMGVLVKPFLAGAVKKAVDDVIEVF